jgi:murein L,D-transpeptidase YafK
MKIIFTIIWILVLFSQVISQNRKDLITEYNKFSINEDHLGISLNGNVNEYGNQEIITVLDSAWAKKKSIILLQLLGYLENPSCGILMFGERELETALFRFKHDNNLSGDMMIGNAINQVLFKIYLKSNNVNQLPHLIRNNSLDYADSDLLFVVYKSELEFQVWAKDKNSDSAYIFISSYPITDSTVARPGPKSKYGDSLTPEGIYSVNFYPAFRWSDFHLAFRVSYPNEMDHARRAYWNTGGKPGGDINIHGYCISIGCIPLGNPVIDEVYFLTRTNQINGSDIRIMIFPFKFDSQSTKNKYYNEFRNNNRMTDFWNSLEDCHTYFKTYNKIPEFKPDQNTGYYIRESR